MPIGKKLTDLTISELKQNLVDKYKDFFEVMFFGDFNYEKSKSDIETKKVVLGKNLKAYLKKFAEDPQGILKNQDEKAEAAIEAAIEKDSKEVTESGTQSPNVHTLTEYKDKDKSELYKIIAYTYDKEIIKGLDIKQWRGNIIFTTIPQSVRLNSRISQIDAITSLSDSIKGEDENIFLFEVKQKSGGFQGVNYTVKSNFKDLKNLTEDQKKYLDKLCKSTTVIKTEMYGKSKSSEKAENKKNYKEIEEYEPENTPAEAENTKIYLVDTTAQKLAGHLVSKGNSKDTILIADAGNAYNPGGDPLGGGSGQEESLIKSDPQLYAHLMTAARDFYEDTTEFKGKKLQYLEKAKSVIALVNIYKKALKYIYSKNRVDNDLLKAIGNEIVRPKTLEKLSDKDLKELKTNELKKTSDISSFMSNLFKSNTFKQKASLTKESKNEANKINNNDIDVKNLATYMLARKSKGKIVMVSPKEIVGSDSQTSEPVLVKKNSYNYVVFNAPDLRSIKEYISAKLCEKLEKLITANINQSVGKTNEQIDAELEKLIETHITQIEENITTKINNRVENSIKYQVAAACKAAVKEKCNYFILGAIGGGIFGCPNDSVANAFKHVLVDKKYKNAFKGVYFAIYKNTKALSAYKKAFGATAEIVDI